VGQPTSPLTEPPPKASEETKRQVLEAARKDPEGEHLGGRDTSKSPEMEGKRKGSPSFTMLLMIMMEEKKTDRTHRGYPRGETMDIFSCEFEIY
jgi:hypothetical protein